MTVKMVNTAEEYCLLHQLNLESFVSCTCLLCSAQILVDSELKTQLYPPSQCHRKTSKNSYHFAKNKSMFMKFNICCEQLVFARFPFISDHAFAHVQQSTPTIYRFPQGQALCKNPPRQTAGNFVSPGNPRIQR